MLMFMKNVLVAGGFGSGGGQWQGVIQPGMPKAVKEAIGEHLCRATLDASSGSTG